VPKISIFVLWPSRLNRAAALSLSGVEQLGVEQSGVKGK